MSDLNQNNCRTVSFVKVDGKLGAEETIQGYGKNFLDAPAHGVSILGNKQHMIAVAIEAASHLELSVPKRR